MFINRIHDGKMPVPRLCLLAISRQYWLTAVNERDGKTYAGCSISHIQPEAYADDALWLVQSTIKIKKILDHLQKLPMHLV